MRGGGLCECGVLLMKAGDAVKILVLGGSGFIGQALIKRLCTDGNMEITVYDRRPVSNRDEKVRYRFIQGDFDERCDFDELTKGFDLIFHLISTSVPGTEQTAAQEISRNVVPSIRLFEAAASNGVKHIVFMSSGGTVYGKGNAGGAPNGEGDVPRPINTYGLQKVCIEEALRFVGRTSATTYQIIRLSNPYGPGQNPHGPLGLITKLVYQTLYGEPIVVYGDGSVVRDFIYIDDAVQGILDIVRNGHRNDTYNLGTGRGTSVKEVVETIDSVLSEQMHVEYVSGRTVDVPVSVLDIAKFRTECASFNEYVSLPEGIRKTADYFKENNVS